MAKKPEKEHARHPCILRECDAPPMTIVELVRHCSTVHGLLFAGKEDAHGNLVAQTIGIANPEKVAAELKPGTIVGRGTGMPYKIPWTKEHLERIYPMVELEPEDNIPVIVNGVRYQLFANVRMTVPSIVRDVYLESRRETRTAHLPKQDSDLRGLGRPSGHPAVERVGIGGLGS